MPFQAPLLMKRLSAVGFALFASPLACAQSMDDWMVLRELAASVLHVQAAVAGRSSSASAVALSSGLVVTNCHVVGESLDARVMRGSLSAPARIVLRDADRDICILSVEGSPAFVPDIGRADTLKVADKVYAVGFGMGRLTTSVGQVEALYP